MSASKNVSGASPRPFELGVDDGDERRDLLPVAGDGLVGDGLAVDADALGEAHEVRAREQARAQPERAGGSRSCGSSRSCRSYRDVDHRCRAVRVAEQFDRPARRVQPRARRALAHAREERRVDRVGRIACSSKSSDASSHAFSSSMWSDDRRRGRRGRPTRRLDELDVELGRERLAGDEVAVRGRRPAPARGSSVSDRRMRSPTSRPAALRASCTARTTSRARPSASSSGVVAVSRITKPPSPSRASAFCPSPEPPASSTRSYSPGSSADATRDDRVAVERPVARARAAWIACCTGLAEPRPRRARVDRQALRDAVRLGARSVERHEVDRLTLSSSRRMASNGASAAASAVTTVRFASGSRTCGPPACAARAPRPLTSRTASIAATSRRRPGTRRRRASPRGARCARR